MFVTKAPSIAPHAGRAAGPSIIYDAAMRPVTASCSILKKTFTPPPFATIRFSAHTSTSNSVLSKKETTGIGILGTVVERLSRSLLTGIYPDWLRGFEGWPCFFHSGRTPLRIKTHECGRYPLISIFAPRRTKI